MATNDLHLLANRLNQLERGNRRYKFAIVLALSAFITIFISGSIQTGDLNVVDATSFVLRDSDGRPRAVIQALSGDPEQKGESVRFALKDSAGRDAFTVSVSPDGETIMSLGAVTEPKQTPNIKIISSLNSAHIDISGKSGISNIRAFVVDKTANVTVSGSDQGGKRSVIGIGSMVKGAIRVLGEDQTILFEATENAQ